MKKLAKIKKLMLSSLFIVDNFYILIKINFFITKL